MHQKKGMDFSLRLNIIFVNRIRVGVCTHTCWLRCSVFVYYLCNLFEIFWHKNCYNEFVILTIYLKLSEKWFFSLHMLKAVVEFLSTTPFHDRPYIKTTHLIRPQLLGTE